jgi:hypothetical protein
MLVSVLTEGATWPADTQAQALQSKVCEIRTYCRSKSCLWSQTLQLLDGDWSFRLDFNLYLLTLYQYNYRNYGHYPSSWLLLTVLDIRERERESGGVVVRDTTIVGGGKHYFLFEGSQALPASPSDRVKLEFRVNLTSFFLILKLLKLEMEGCFRTKFRPTLWGLHSGEISLLPLRRLHGKHASCLLFKTQLNSIGLSVPHRKHIMSPLRAQQVNAIYRFVTTVY